MKMRTLALALGLAAAVVLPAMQTHAQGTQQTGTQQQARAGAIAEVALVSTLVGAEIVGDTGASTGKVDAKVSLRPASSEVCYEIPLAEFPNATGVHIHKAPKGENGPAVLSLAAPEEGIIKGCTEAERAVFTDIQGNPANYYLLLVTPAHEKGAARGQLSPPK